MRFEPNVKTVEMYGIEESQTMTIAATGKVFYAFISGLYSNKVESVVRETTSNARDGHIKRGNVDKPFVVHAPTSWEPFYSVRDFGCSMTHEFVMRHFTTIGYSDKEQSDTLVGTWGFGSKSPFALTSQFTVTCWKDGSCRVYNCHLGEDGKPNIALMSNEPSEEPDGVQVRFDVKSYEISDFHRAIRKVALSHVPSFTSSLSGVHSRVISEDNGDHYFSNDASAQSGPFVEIGCVWYPIDFGQIPDSHLYKAIMKAHDLVLRSDISALAIVPSRESLEYNKKTKDGLVAMLNKVIEHHSKPFHDEITACATLWEAMSVYRKFNATPNAVLHSMLENSHTKFGTLSKETVLAFPANGNVSIFTHNGGGDYSVSGNGHASRLKTTVVIVNDLAKPAVTRIRRRIGDEMERRGIEQAILVHLPDVIGETKRLSERLRKEESERGIRKYQVTRLKTELEYTRTKLLEQIDRFGCPDQIDAQSLPEPIKRKSDVVRSFTYYMVRSSGKFEICGKIKADEAKVNIVFPVSRDRILDLPARHEIVEAAKVIGVEIAEMTGIAQSSMARFLRDNPEWRDYREVFHKDIPCFSQIEAYGDALARKYHLDIGTFTTHADRMQKLRDSLPAVPPEFTTYISAFARLQVERKEIDEAAKLAGEALGEITGRAASNLYLLATGGRLRTTGDVSELVKEVRAKHEAAVELCPALEVNWRYEHDKARIHVAGLMTLRSYDSERFAESLVA